MEKDYSLLRPFDLEKAKAGGAICYYQDGTHREFITGPDDHGYFVIKSQDGWFRFGKHEDYRMAPLAWVEGKPVYKGDVLYSHFFKETFEVTGIDRVGQFKAEKHSQFSATESTSCTWTPPKKTREVKLLGYLTSNNLVWYKDAFKAPLEWSRVPSEDRTVTVEE